MHGRIDEPVLVGGVELAPVKRTSESNVERIPGKISSDEEVTFDDKNVPAPTRLDEGKPSCDFIHNIKQWSVTLVLLVGLITTWLLYSGVSSLFDVWQQHPWVGGGLTLLSVTLLFHASTMVTTEYRSLQAVDILSLRKDEIIQAKNNDELNDVRKALVPVILQLGENNPELISAFEERVNRNQKSTSCCDYLESFNEKVVIPLDGRVNDLIKRESMGAALSTAMLPHPALDALFVFWRSVKLNRTIASIYGLETTNLAAIKLSKHALSAVIAASSAAVSEQVANTFITGVLNTITEKAMQGTTNGVRMYRLGKQIQAICRPVEL